MITTLATAVSATGDAGNVDELGNWSQGDVAWPVNEPGQH